MPTQPPLPPLLTPYVSFLPQSSLTLLSSVLGATGNWLVLRYLYAALSASTNTTFGADGLDNGKKRKVVLVSFLRSWDFWRSEAKRLGLDLAQLSDKGQFAFVDGLSELFYTPQAQTAAPVAPSAPAPFAPAGRPIPPRTALPVRGPPGASAPAPTPAVPGGCLNRAATEAGPGPAKRLHLIGQGTAALDALEKDISDVVSQLKATGAGNDGEEAEVLLIVDQPDLLLAATGPSKGIGATEMGEWVMGLQQHSHATIVAVSADSPLIHNASEFAHHPATPLEKEHAAFAVGLAHRAQMVMQLRNLETGAARDVSGVLRASKGGAWSDDGSTDAETKWEEKEVLYFIQRDGSVNVFGRGE
ncbi:hypothetical protein SI65_06350 [Aspergillus cristatus]|uniref:Elongator complex protein 6 n=1 Tax=Aspergillus cristatus TaxID=573508 RepID=A0A1E3BC20_ASPCR|nr:hypothetical protein SI65_06350 [Aspergillus cristatus]